MGVPPMDGATCPPRTLVPLITMAVSSSDKALLGAAAALVVVSAGVFGYLGLRSMAAVDAPPPTVQLAETPYEPVATEAPAIKTETWSAPVAQKRGREWIYDTFTPPEIFYNARSKQFTVKPPSSLMDEESMEVFGLELVEVRPEPFPLQLIGFVGDEGNWRGMFQNMVTGEMLLAQAGHRVPKLGLTIREFDVRAQPIGSPESMTTRQRVASAVIRDERSARDVTLTHRERFFTGTMFAFVAAPGETATREVRLGDVFKIGDATYKVENIQATPPAIEVTKEASTLTRPDRRLLTPREVELPEDPEPAEPSGDL